MVRPWTFAEAASPVVPRQPLPYRQRLARNG